jgi:hypothetical protein
MSKALDALQKTVDACFALIECLDGENKRLRAEIDQNRIDLEEYRRDVDALRAENARLKGALESIAIKAGMSECGGDYVAAVTVIGDIERMADKALAGETT